ncbi:hypothetical protein AgCh_032903 [Apium graveolens]
MEANTIKKAKEIEIFEKRSNELKAKGLSRVSPDGVFLNIKTHIFSRMVSKIKAREKTNSNQQEKKNSEFFPKNQRTRAVVVRGQAKSTELQRAHAGEARGRAGSNSKNLVSTLILI